MNHYIFNDREFEQHFADGTFPVEAFTHEAHLRLAWIHLNRFAIDRAIENICSQLKSFTIALGAFEKYNETVTIAAIRAVYHFMLKSRTGNFEDFITENSRLKTHFKELLAQHYQTDIFNSADAKKKFLEPELEAFD